MKKYQLFISKQLCRIGIHDFRSVKVTNIFYPNTDILKKIQETKRCTRCSKEIVVIYRVIKGIGKSVVNQVKEKNKP